MPTYKLVTEDGTWLTDERLNGFDWKAGDRIFRGPGDTLEVVEVRDSAEEKPTLVVRPGRDPKSDKRSGAGGLRLGACCFRNRCSPAPRGSPRAAGGGSSRSWTGSGRWSARATAGFGFVAAAAGT